jgi:hypothetical protein
LVTQKRSAFLEKWIFSTLEAQNYFFHNVFGVLGVALFVARGRDCSARNILRGKEEA